MDSTILTRKIIPKLMRSRLLSVFIALPGWVLISTYLAYESIELGGFRVLAEEHLTETGPLVLIFHILIFLSPVFSTLFGFAVKRSIESETRLHSITETAKDAIVTIDQRGTITSWNSAAKRIFGYDSEKAVGRRVDILIPQDNTHGDTLWGRGAQKNNELVGRTFEVKALKKGGEEFPAEVSLSKWLSAKGTFFTAIIRDISERKEAEETIKKYARDLERSNSLKELFIDNLTHDLTNSIFAARGYAEILRTEETDPGKGEDLGRIIKNLTKTEKIVENAKTLSRLENVDSLEFKEMDLKEVVNETTESLKLRAENSGIEIENRIAGEMFTRANEIIEEVFSNLISNALKYGGEGERIVVEGEEAGANWRVRVIDYGEGVPDRYKDKIFNRFERREKEGIKGSGLGLSITRRIVKLHGGKIWVEDTPGGGATFVVELPKS